MAGLEHVLAVNLMCPFQGVKHKARVMVPVWLHHPEDECCGIGGRPSVARAGGPDRELCRHQIRVNCVSLAGVPTQLTMDKEAFKQAMETLSNLRATNGNGSSSVGWTENPTRDEIELGEKSHPHPWVKIHI
jgi:hypothetical protein